MTDVTVAPSGGAPAAAPSNEVVIDTNPVSVPSPVGSQAPDKPTGDVQGSPHRTPSRRETIQRAYDRAMKPEQQDGKDAPTQARRPGMGHNNPPEPTQREQPKPPQREAQREQQDQRPPQHREAGRFARDPQQQSSQQQQPQQPHQPQQVRRLPEGTPYRDPPQRFADHAKAEWHTAPESVRGEVHRMAHEFSKAYQQYRGDHEAMNAIRPFHDMATQTGTTLQKALSNYVNMEQKLRQDVIGGLDVIVRNLQLKTPEGQPIGLRELAYYIANMSPDQHRLTQQQNQQVAAQHQIGALHQEIAGLKNVLYQMHTAQQFTHTRGAVDQYADAHPRFDELGDLIEQELKLGFDLDTAYRRAELLRPSTHAAQTRNPSAQTRQPDRSISGAPSGGPSNGSATASRKNDQPLGRRDAIQRAIKRVNGSL